MGDFNKISNLNKINHKNKSFNSFSMYKSERAILNFDSSGQRRKSCYFILMFFGCGILKYIFFFEGGINHIFFQKERK